VTWRQDTSRQHILLSRIKTDWSLAYRNAAHYRYTRDSTSLEIYHSLKRYTALIYDACHVSIKVMRHEMMRHEMMEWCKWWHMMYDARHCIMSCLMTCITWCIMHVITQHMMHDKSSVITQDMMHVMARQSDARDDAVKQVSTPHSYHCQPAIKETVRSKR